MKKIIHLLIILFLVSSMLLPYAYASGEDYDRGYNDGYSSVNPREPDNKDYMRGYEAGEDDVEKDEDN